MAHYFASDVHLRSDRPERDRRFSEWLTILTPNDALLIAGDLCDFWMAARSSKRQLLQSNSLARLADFERSGGSLAIMPGNHDAWLCPFYASELGAEIVPDPLDLTVFGLRLRIVHGHLLGARRAWKSLLEGRLFFRTFGLVPSLPAALLDKILARHNDRELLADEERHLRVFREYASTLRGAADLVLFGHVHRAVDEFQSDPRLIVLGGWQARFSFLKVDDRGASYHVIEDQDPQRPRDIPSPSATTSSQGQVS